MVIGEKYRYGLNLLSDLAKASENPQTDWLLWCESVANAEERKSMALRHVQQQVVPAWMEGAGCEQHVARYKCTMEQARFSDFVV